MYSLPPQTDLVLLIAWMKVALEAHAGITEPEFLSKTKVSKVERDTLAAITGNVFLLLSFIKAKVSVA